jgi:hypothetical protein
VWDVFGRGLSLAFPFSCAVVQFFSFLVKWHSSHVLFEEKKENNASLKMHFPVGSISGENCDR